MVGEMPYVIGLAFAIAGYSSFWLILAMCLLTALVGVNYIAICRHYPDGAAFTRAFDIGPRCSRSSTPFS